MINFFPCRRKCGEIFGSLGSDKFETIFPWENMKENLPPSFSRLGVGDKKAKFHHLNLLGAVLRKVCENTPANF